jgi:predicted O-methyltransferase YrrM
MPIPLEKPPVIFEVSTNCKQKALDAMKHFHGWCTENKASILIDLILRTRPAIVVEVGVFGGKSLAPMAFAVQENGFGTVIGIDPWSAKESVQGMEGENKEWWAKVDHEMIYQDLLAKINHFGLQKEIQLIRTTSEAAPLIQSIDIVHIDGNHSEDKALLDIHKWVPLVKKDGHIVFDDVYWGTTAAAVAWLDRNCDRVGIYNDNCGWGIWKKR